MKNLILIFIVISLCFFCMMFYVWQYDKKMFKETGDCYYSFNPGICDCEKVGGKFIRTGLGGSCVFPLK